MTRAGRCSDFDGTGRLIASYYGHLSAYAGGADCCMAFYLSLFQTKNVQICDIIKYFRTKREI